MNVSNILLKAVAITMLLVIISGSVFAQKEKKKKNVPTSPTLITEDKLPMEVAKAYKKRFATALSPQWHNNGVDTIYTVYALVREVENEITFGKSGAWISTVEPIDPRNMLAACHKTMDMYFTQYRVESASKITRADKNNQILVNILEQENLRSGVLTKVYLDKAGKLIKIEYPNETEQEQDYMVDRKAQKEAEKMDKEFERDRQLDIYPTKIKEEELPTGILTWVAKNYPDYIFKEIEYDQDEDFPNEGRIYIINIQRNGINQPDAMVWFTRDGSFLKLTDEFNQRNEVANREPQEIRRVPTVVETAFDTKYPTIGGATWSPDEFGYWVGAYTDKYGRNFASFDEEGTWIKTRTVVDYSKVPYAVRSAVEAAFPKGELEESFKVTAPNEKPYYTLVVYNKKDKTTTSVDYLQTGKPRQ